MSSSLLPPPSTSTLGLIHTGGTGTQVHKRYSGRTPGAKFSNSQSDMATRTNRSWTRTGFKTSVAFFMWGLMVSFSRATRSREASRDFARFAFLENLSCRRRGKPVAFLLTMLSYCVCYFIFI